MRSIQIFVCKLPLAIYLWSVDFHQLVPTQYITTKLQIKSRLTIYKVRLCTNRKLIQFKQQQGLHQRNQSKYNKQQN